MAESGARQRALSDEDREELIKQTRADFDADLAADLTDDAVRVSRARENARAMQGLMEAMQRANAEVAAQ